MTYFDVKVMTFGNHPNSVSSRQIFSRTPDRNAPLTILSTFYRFEPLVISVKKLS